MIHQHHANGIFIALLFKFDGTESCQIEAGHDVRHDDDGVAVDLLNLFQTIGCIGNGHQRIGVGVVNKFVGQGGMQNCFDRRCRRSGISHVGA